ncbi:MAG TPA: energy transducer TonB [Candidatus Acidoferrales bacterium]|nr:energy transducer TonB [Candidatus Acidoferrales bacterium]
MILVSALVLCGSALAQTEVQPTPEPDRFDVGRDTFFDFGPPFNYYEVFIVRPAAAGSSVTRILLTPVVDACFLPAKVEAGSARLEESVSDLLGPINPCEIPEKVLRQEEKRCKNCLVFSGANVSMQVPCGAGSRVIKAKVLEQDWFEKFPNTPKNTQWTMTLLERLDKAIGPGVMDKPTFPAAAAGQPSDAILDPEIRSNLASGKYDALFEGASDKPSDLYVAAQKQPVVPTARVLSVEPLNPETLVQPEFPPLARLAHFEGSISVTFEVGFNGAPINLMLESGPSLLYGAAMNAVKQWRFPESASGQRVHATFEFKTNCPRTSP